MAAATTRAPAGAGARPRPAGAGVEGHHWLGYVDGRCAEVPHDEAAPHACVLAAANDAEWVRRFRDLHEQYDVFQPGYPVGVPPERLAVRLELPDELLDRKVAALRAQDSQTPHSSKRSGPSGGGSGSEPRASPRPSAVTPRSLEQGDAAAGLDDRFDVVTAEAGFQGLLGAPSPRPLACSSSSPSMASVAARTASSAESRRPRSAAAW